MGYHNGIAASEQWGDLDDVQHRVFVRMALEALDRDDDEPPVYRNGREPLLRTVARGRPVPSDEDASAAKANGDRALMKERQARIAALDRAVAALITAGAVRRLSKGYRGHNAEYALALPRPTKDHALTVVHSDAKGPRSDRGPLDDRLEANGPRFGDRMDHGLDANAPRSDRGPKEVPQGGNYKEGPQDRSGGPGGPVRERAAQFVAEKITWDESVTEADQSASALKFVDLLLAEAAKAGKPIVDPLAYVTAMGDDGVNGAYRRTVQNFTNGRLSSHRGEALTVVDPATVGFCPACYADGHIVLLPCTEHGA